MSGLVCRDLGSRMPDLGCQLSGVGSRMSDLLRWLVYLIDPVANNLLKCFIFPQTWHTVSFETKFPFV